MALTLRQLVSERRKFFRSLKPLFRKASRELEDVEREIKRILSRKTKAPEVTDIDRLLKMLGEHADALDRAVNSLRKGFLN